MTAIKLTWNPHRGSATFTPTYSLHTSKINLLMAFMISMKNDDEMISKPPKRKKALFKMINSSSHNNNYCYHRRCSHLVPRHQYETALFTLLCPVLNACSHSVFSTLSGHLNFRVFHDVSKAHAFFKCTNSTCFTVRSML